MESLFVDNWSETNDVSRITPLVRTRRRNAMVTKLVQRSVSHEASFSEHNVIPVNAIYSLLRRLCSVIMSVVSVPRDIPAALVASRGTRRKNVTVDAAYCRS